MFDEYFEDRTDDEKALIKKKFGTTQAILEAPQRIRRVCLDIIKHYRNHIKPNNFKAMIVTSSRNAAIIYKEQLDKLEAPQSVVIISVNIMMENDIGIIPIVLNTKQIEDLKNHLSG